MDGPHAPSQSTTFRSFNGCWTCRLRRKKCDEKRPLCGGCATLHIDCHYTQEKPEWMDGGVRQEAMAERVKQEVKEKARRRRNGELAGYTHENRFSSSEASTHEVSVFPQTTLRTLATPPDDPPREKSIRHNGRSTPACAELPTMSFQRGTSCALTSSFLTENVPFTPSDTILLMFYIEHMLPFLFPFYQPPLLQGGRAWILEMMMSSPVVRQAALCQSSYFFSLARGAANHDKAWETVLSQTRDAFEVLRRSLQVIEGANIGDHIHGAVRIMASIMQVQRFEISILSFDNCQSHLSASLALFIQLMDSAQEDEPATHNARFNSVLARLGPSSWTLPDHSIQMPSAEQAAFSFSSSLLLLDDIVASTVLQEPPKLYELHHALLGRFDNSEPIINLETAVGCQNWVLVQIGEIAMLDTWKQQCKSAGNLDIMQLVHKATFIKTSLETSLKRLDTGLEINSRGISNPLDVFTADSYQYPKIPADQRVLVTRVWAHAALLYLYVVVSGWQPASVEVRHHVGQIMELISLQLSPPRLLRTIVWPFCVAGCLAGPLEQVQLRPMVNALQPPSMFGAVRKALDIMENVWRNQNAGNPANRDLAACFRSQGNLVLLV